MEQNEEFPAFDEADLNERLEKLSVTARRLGLHMIPPSTVTATPDGLKVGAVFAIGDLAWSDEVQNPTAAFDKAEVKHLEKSFEQIEFDEVRETIRRRMEGEA